MRPIAVIGVGPGRQGLLTLDAQEALRQADIVFCAKRHSLLVPDKARVRSLIPFQDAILQMQQCAKADQAVAVLLSGDTGLYSMLPMLIKHLGRERLHVYPGISALQSFCASMGIVWQNVRILSAHGRALTASALCHEARTHGQVVLFLDEVHDPNWVHESLLCGGLTHVKLVIGERLSYADECIAPYEPRAYQSLSMAYVENGAPDKGLPPIGLPDEAFIRAKTPMTKREIRIQALAALALPPDAVVWDIGAGTGSVSVECARQCPLGSVYAIERNGDAVGLLHENIRQFHLLNVSVISGNAPDALYDLPAPTHVFLGGTGGASEAIVQHLKSLARPIAIVATAVTLESASTFTRLLGQLPNFQAVQLSATRLEAIGDYTMLKGLNPVFLFSAQMEVE